MPENKSIPFAAYNVEKTFRERNWWGNFRTIRAVHDLSFTLVPGEAFGLIGPNGAGKSTTIKMLMGLVHPSQGNLKLNGWPVTDPRARRGVGFLPEHPSLYNQLTAHELVTGAARMQGLGRREAEGDAQRLLGEMGLEEVRHKTVGKFSKGMLQRTAIAHALAGNPNLLVVDEPLSGLDPIWRSHVVERLMAFRDAGGTVLFSSHILADVERLADRIGILHRGALLTVTTPADLIGRYVAHYVVRTRGSYIPEAISARREGPDQWSLEVPEVDLWPTLEEIRHLAHQIVEVRPAGAGLEGALMRFLQESTTSA
jgi:ABC-2 type transport system ATP-binding protein